MCRGSKKFDRLEVKHRALDALASARPESHNQGPLEGGYVTKNGIKTASEGTSALQVIQNAGGDDGARTRDLMRDSSKSDNSNKSGSNA